MSFSGPKLPKIVLLGETICKYYIIQQPRLEVFRNVWKFRNVSGNFAKLSLNLVSILVRRKPKRKRLMPIKQILNMARVPHTWQEFLCRQYLVFTCQRSFSPKRSFLKTFKRRKVGEYFKRHHVFLAETRRNLVMLILKGQNQSFTSVQYHAKLLSDLSRSAAYQSVA